MKHIGRFSPMGAGFPAAGEPAIAETGTGRITLEIRPTFWTDIANAVWSLQHKTSDPSTNNPRDEFRSVSRHIARLGECLAELGIEIQSHTNQPFDSGQSLEVVAFQPTAGIVREIVTETIRPTIYLQGHRLQTGQVIVATPDHSRENQ